MINFVGVSGSFGFSLVQPRGKSRKSLKETGMVGSKWKCRGSWFGRGAGRSPDGGREWGSKIRRVPPFQLAKEVVALQKCRDPDCCAAVAYSYGQVLHTI